MPAGAILTGQQQKRTLRTLLLSSVILSSIFCACSKKNLIKDESSPLKEVTVSGRVLHRGEPVTAAAVQVFNSVNSIIKDSPIISAGTDSDGRYSIVLPHGKYFFIAKKGDALFSYSGRNPITVSGDEDLWVGFQAERVEPSVELSYDDEFSSAISGKVLHNGAPVKDAYVTVFLDGSDDFKGPGYSITSTDADGEFIFDYLPESEYFILARKRRSGEKVGPISDDDLYAYYPHNPLTTKDGKTTAIKLNCVSKIADPRVDKEVLPETGFSGRVLDTDGRPLSGMHVFAYTDPVIGHKRPASLSSVTKSDGRYIVELKEAGTYFIGARERHGDSPAPRERFGMYDKTADHGLKVDDGTFIKGIDIVVEKIMMK